MLGAIHFVGTAMQRLAVAEVNAKTTESCTALSFALDCTNEDEQALECVRLLLEAKADVPRTFQSRHHLHWGKFLKQTQMKVTFHLRVFFFGAESVDSLDLQLKSFADQRCCKSASFGMHSLGPCA